MSLSVAAPAAAAAPPSVQIAVAAIALFGVLVSAVITWFISRKDRHANNEAREANKRSTEKLQNALAASEAQMQSHQHDFQRYMQTREEAFQTAFEKMRQAHQKQLHELEDQSERQLESFKASLAEQAERRRILVELNEENFRRVHEGIRRLRDVGFDMSSAFKALANSAHTNLKISEDQLIKDSLTALRLHEEFRTVLKTLRTEIRRKDYDELKSLLREMVIVFLDVGRTVQEREVKAEQMRAHERSIEKREEHFATLVEGFLQPYSRSKSGSPLADRSPGAVSTRE